MKIKHEDHYHEVYLSDDGTMDTVVDVDGVEVRYREADRFKDGEVKREWLHMAAIEACDDGLLSEEEN